MQQKQTSSETIEYLKIDWLNSVVQNVKISLRDIGKGCFDLNQTTPYIYDVMKLKRFVCLKIFIMQVRNNKEENRLLKNWGSLLEELF